MPPNKLAALCVSIHDVAPATWAACMALWAALREVRPDLPLTWLVVPCYHGQCGQSAEMEQILTAALASGHELTLHGYYHLDHGPPPASARERLLRQSWTTGEGEFAAISQPEALRLLDLGLDWFALRDWPVRGFVPPAWLVSKDALAALRQRPFQYMTTMSRFAILPDGPSLRSPSLVYTARQRAGRWLSPRVANAMAAAMAGQQLIRLSLHPADAAHPALVRHAQHLLERLLRDRTPMTKGQFADHFRVSGLEASGRSGLAIGTMMEEGLPGSGRAGLTVPSDQLQ